MDPTAFGPWSDESSDGPWPVSEWLSLVTSWGRQQGKSSVKSGVEIVSLILRLFTKTRFIFYTEEKNAVWVLNCQNIFQCDFVFCFREVHVFSWASNLLSVLYIRALQLVRDVVPGQTMLMIFRPSVHWASFLGPKLMTFYLNCLSFIRFCQLPVNYFTTFVTSSCCSKKSILWCLDRCAELNFVCAIVDENKRFTLEPPNFQDQWKPHVPVFLDSRSNGWTRATVSACNSVHGMQSQAGAIWMCKDLSPSVHIHWSPHEILLVHLGPTRPRRRDRVITLPPWKTAMMIDGTLPSHKHQSIAIIRDGPEHFLRQFLVMNRKRLRFRSLDMITNKTPAPLSCPGDRLREIRGRVGRLVNPTAQSSHSQ